MTRLLLGAESVAVGLELGDLCRRHGLDPSTLVEVPGARSNYPMTRFVRDRVVLEVAGTDEARRRLRLEAAGRTWARDRGLAVPLTIEADPAGGWLLGEWVQQDARSVSGREYVEAAVAAADVIAGETDLPAAVEHASSWRAPRRDRLVRWPRLLGGGLPPALWIAARAQVRDLNREQAPAHGDFYPRNVLGTRAGVCLVDWEYLGLSPRFTDVARMWSVLRSSADRDRLLSLVLAGKSATEQRCVGAMLLWHSLRLLGENLTAQPVHRTPETLAHARAMLPEAREVATCLGAWPR